MSAPDSETNTNTLAANGRQALKDARRIIVKVGSRVLASQPGLPARIAAEFQALHADGRCGLLVSSGATAIGIERLGYEARPTELSQLQAAASAGQSVLMRRYDEAFASRGLTSAQVLLTNGDLANRSRVNNARHALAALLDAGAVPIINENDVVTTKELRFSDNDQLASMVAPLISADALILLSDVDGVLDAEGKRIGMLKDIASFTDHGPSEGGVGRGGMSSKLDAAHKARRSGAAVVIASAKQEGVISSILAGEDVGTLITPIADTLRARQHWIAYTLRPRGAVLVDAGAAEVIAAGDSSLLPVGVLGIRGNFRRGDSVRLIGPDGAEIARGLTRLTALEVARVAGTKGEELTQALGGQADAVVVHKDDLVIDRREN